MKIFKFVPEGLTPEQAQKRQNMVMFVSIAAFIIFCLSIVFFTGQKPKKVPFSMDDKKGKIELNVTGGAKAENSWLEGAENKLKELDKLKEAKTNQDKEIAALKTELEEYKKNNEGLKDHKALVDGYYEEMEKMAKRLSDLEAKKPGAVRTNNHSAQFSQNSPFITAGQEGQGMQAPISAQGSMNIDFDLEGENGDIEYKSFNTKEYLPAGSYVPAVVISGVDASVGVSSQSDPRPVLFRIDGDAVSAKNEGEPQKVDLKGCTVTGAASGDLSSEKVFVRLLKMTCSREDNKVIETDVKGYATAIGKAGIRGDVVSREGDLVIKSFFAGLAGGVGNGMAQSLTTPATIVGGVATQTPDAKDIAGQGLGRGLQSSADRLADYLIKRAEQYQPVISIPAGIDVELVFHEGVYLDGRSEVAHKTKENKEKVK